MCMNHAHVYVRARAVRSVAYTEMCVWCVNCMCVQTVADISAARVMETPKRNPAITKQTKDCGQCDTKGCDCSYTAIWRNFRHTSAHSEMPRRAEKRRGSIGEAAGRPTWSIASARTRIVLSEQWWLGWMVGSGGDGQGDQKRSEQSPKNSPRRRSPPPYRHQG